MSYTVFRTHKEAVARKGVEIVLCDEVRCRASGLSSRGLCSLRQACALDCRDVVVQ